jgi:DNA-binding SARP family transcriptional activator
MGLLTGAGRRTEALQVYEALASALKQTLEVTPSPDVVALHACLIAEIPPQPALIEPQQPQDTRRTNLRVALTSFVGRTREQEEVHALITKSRLPGGRLAGRTSRHGCKRD